jgi:hypothetical protein
MTQPHTCDSNNQAGAPSEMAIVDTFTKLIFGEEHYSGREDLVIAALRLVDSNVTLDSHRDMGQYLRALGVNEMIRLVSRVETQLEDGLQVLASATAPARTARRGQRSPQRR